MDDCLHGTVDLRIGDRRATLQTSLLRGEVAFRDVIPLARQMTGAVVAWAVEDTEARGKRVTCGPKCGACCRQAVPIGHAEARRLAELVEALPEPHRTKVRARFDEALRRLRGTDLPQRYEELGAADEGSGPSSARIAWGIEYFKLGIPCPFLEDESCSIHAERPLICREYLVTSDPAACATLSQGIEGVPIAARVSRAARAIGQEDASIVDWMPLVSVLDWAQAHPQPPVRQPALAWVAGLQQRLGRQPEAGPASALLAAHD
jgi:Fe-S-cluster containining protein